MVAPERAGRKAPSSSREPHRYRNLSGPEQKTMRVFLSTFLAAVGRSPGASKRGRPHPVPPRARVARRDDPGSPLEITGPRSRGAGGGRAGGSQGHLRRLSGVRPAEGRRLVGLPVDTGRPSEGCSPPGSRACGMPCGRWARLFEAVGRAWRGREIERPGWAALENTHDLALGARSVAVVQAGSHASGSLSDVLSRQTLTGEAPLAASGLSYPPSNHFGRFSWNHCLEHEDTSLARIGGEMVNR